MRLDSGKQPPLTGWELALQGDIAAATTAWIGELLSPIPVQYGALSDLATSAEVLSSAGGYAERRWASGGGIYRYPYEVYLRVLGRNDAARINALNELSKVAVAIEARQFPDAEVGWVANEVTNLPNLWKKDKDGREIYQLTATLTFAVEAAK